MTILVVPKPRSGEAEQLLANDVIAYSRTENWLVIHHNQTSELLRKLDENGITSRMEAREYTGGCRL